MIEITCNISFTTPAFIGNAEQRAQWRTPPFKPLLRQWWRVVKAPSVEYNYRELLKSEGELFGRAADGEATKSQLRLRLLDNAWKHGTMENINNCLPVEHPEVLFPNRPKERQKKLVHITIWAMARLPFWA